MNGGSVVASLPLTSPLITPSTGEAEPRGSSYVLYDTYNTFCTIHIRNVLNATNEWAPGVCRKVQVARRPHQRGGAEREFACPANGPTSTGTIMAKIDLRSRGRVAIFGRYEWASVGCRKAQVVQSLPHHAEY